MFFWHNSPLWARVSSFTRFLYHTQRHTTVGTTPLDEWSTRRRDFYLTTHNTHNRQTSMPPLGFEPTFSAGEWTQTYALDRAANGTGIRKVVPVNITFVGPWLNGIMKHELLGTTASNGHTAVRKVWSISSQCVPFKLLFVITKASQVRGSVYFISTWPGIVSKIRQT